MPTRAIHVALASFAIAPAPAQENASHAREALRPMARVELQLGALRAESTRLGALFGERASGAPLAVPALRSVRHALRRSAAHLEVLAARARAEEPWRFALTALLAEPAERIRLEVWWAPAPANALLSASASLHAAIGWSRVRAEVLREIEDAFGRRRAIDLDADPQRVVLPLEMVPSEPSALLLGWNEEGEVFLARGKRALERALAAERSDDDRDERASEGVTAAAQLDLAEVSAWLENALLGREPAPPQRAAIVSLEKELRADSSRDRLRFPASAAVAAESGTAGMTVRICEPSSGWLRIALAPPLRGALFALAHAALTAQGLDAAWIDDARELAAGVPSAAGGLVCAPSIVSFALRPALWFAGGPPAATVLTALGYVPKGEGWTNGRSYVVALPSAWLVAERAADLRALRRELESQELASREGPWIGEVHGATFELYAGLRLALLKGRSSFPAWARAWIEGLPTPRACGAILAPARWTLRACDGELEVEGGGPLGDPPLTLLQLLLARAVVRALDIELRDSLEAEYAERTRAAIVRAALAARAACEAAPERDPRPLLTEELAWRSPMDPEEEPTPALRLVRATELPAIVRQELGLSGAPEECPWAVVEASAWFRGGTLRHAGACSGAHVRVVATGAWEPRGASGR